MGPALNTIDFTTLDLNYQGQALRANVQDGSESEGVGSQDVTEGADILPVEEERTQFGHKLEKEHLRALERSVVGMALSRIEGTDELYVGGIWALRRSDSLKEQNITHVLSLVAFNPRDLKNFKDEPFSEYGKPFQHSIIDVDDVEDEDILIHLPQAVKFIDQGLRGVSDTDEKQSPEEQNLESGSEKPDLVAPTPSKGPGVFVHCAAGKSRSVSVIVAYLLWRYPNRFGTAAIAAAAAAGDPLPATPSRKDTAKGAVKAAVDHIRITRPMAEPNDGFKDQLALWWEMECPNDVESHPAYQRWAYRREVQESIAVGQVPSNLRFEDELSDRPAEATPSGGVNLRCKKCRRTLVTSQFIVAHDPPPLSSSYVREPTPCQHVFIEPLSWMRPELEKGELSGRLNCPNPRCGAGVGRYDWKGFRCSCTGWLTPAFSLQKAKVDEDIVMPANVAASRNLGIRMPPGPRNAGHL